MRSLVVYFSWSGNTQEIAEMLRQKTQADMFRIERVIPYSMDYHTCAYVEAKDEVDHHRLPEIRKPVPNISPYDVVFLAFPIWWYTVPAPVLTFLSEYDDWQDKAVYVFANADSNSPDQFVNAVRDTAACAKGACVIPGLYNQEIEKIDTWLNTNGFGR